MFIIPTIDVLLLGMAVTIALAALQWLICGPSLRNPWVHEAGSRISQRTLRARSWLHSHERILAADLWPWEG